MNRIQILRWLLEKLLGSFIISILVIWGPVLGMNLGGYGIGTVYTIITSISILVSGLVYLLVPTEFGIKERFSRLFKRNKIKNGN